MSIANGSAGEAAQPEGGQFGLPLLSGRLNAGVEVRSLTKAFPPGAKVDAVQPLSAYRLVADSGELLLHVKPRAHISQAMLVVSDGHLEVITAVPRGVSYHSYLRGDKPIIYLFHGWWGNAAKMLAFMDDLADRHHFLVRAFSLAGHGASRRMPESTWKRWRYSLFGTYPQDIQDILEAFAAEPKALVLHSAASFWSQRAFDSAPTPILNSIQNIVFAAPEEARGTLLATLRCLVRMARDAAAGQWMPLVRYLGQLRFWAQETGINYFIRSAATTRQVLFSPHTSLALCQSYVGELDTARYCDYMMACCRWLVRPFAS